MATLIFILILLAGYHFIVENMIVPVMRDQLKYRFIALRDKLILLKLKNAISENVFDQLNRIVCTSANNLHHLDLFSFIAFYKRKKQQRVKSKQLFKFLTRSSNAEIKPILENIIKYAGKAFLINSMAWALYLLPLIPLFCFAVLCNGALQRVLKKRKVFFEFAKAWKVMLIIYEQQPGSTEIFTDAGNSNYTGEFLPE